MIVCSCNLITDHDIRDAVDTHMLDQPLDLLSPVQVYKLLGKRPRCGGCLANANEIIQARAAYLRGDTGAGPSVASGRSCPASGCACTRSDDTPFVSPTTHSELRD